MPEETSHGPVWERRWDPLRQTWVTITSHRNSRPWSGGEKAADIAADPVYLDDCYLCPGNARVSGRMNPAYDEIFVFDNDHPSYSLPPPPARPTSHPVFKVAPAGGQCRVICYAPQHNESLAHLGCKRARSLIDVWASQTADLRGNPDVASILIFENRGEVVGVSNHHPHGQIYAPDFVFDNLGLEAAVFQQSEQPLMQAILSAEREAAQRLVVEGQSTSAFVPYFARFPYETYVVPHAQHAYIDELSVAERDDLAMVLSETLIRFDNLWNSPFPYMMILHQAPCDADDRETRAAKYDAFHFHIQIHPPMRAAGLQKYLASVETGMGHFLNDGSPEDKAAELRSVSDIHYLDR